MQQKVQKLLSDWYKIQIEKFDSFKFNNFIVKRQGKDEIDEIKLKQFISQTPIEELGIENTAFDTDIINNVLKQPLLIEIKEFQNVSQPFQRAIDPGDDDEKVKTDKKKDQTYQLKAHDGKRFIKIILLFDNQSAFVRTLHEVNKFCLYDAFLTPMESSTFVLDYQEQIAQIYTEKNSTKLSEAYAEIKGLPIKYTNAPRFVFLNENATEEGAKEQEEQEDEFSDIYQKFSIPDLISSERTYIKRFEQIGFWRKKFN